MKQIKLTNNNSSKRIETTSERRIVKLKKILLKEDGEFISVSPDKVNLQYQTYGDVQQTGSIPIRYSDKSKKELVFDDGEIPVNWDNVSSIEFILNINNQKLAEYELIILYEDFERVEDKKSSGDFLVHINKPKNHNILFSGRYGQGKSTFLQEFFKENDKKFDVFKVFPVNYSVASNEDIFKYIKADILLQLMGKGVRFDESSFTHVETVQQYILTEPKTILMSLLRTGLSLSQNTSHLVDAIQNFERFCQEYKHFHKELQDSDESKAISYVKELFEKEGSLFEDNFYTQLIRQLVDRNKENPEKRSVLIIDDLDRMDPDHIFRILNVISAHCDSFNLDNEKFNNKFGFDHIIVVCDIENIRNIFEHRFGKKVDFPGYIDKFYSTEVYHFNSATLIEFLINKLELSFGNNGFQNGIAILKICSELGLINNRDLVKTYSTKSFSKIHSENYSDSSSQVYKYRMSQQVYFPVILVLVQQFGKTHLLEKLELSKDKSSVTLRNNLDEICEALLIGLVSENSNAKVHNLKVAGNNYSFEIVRNMDGYKINDLRIIDGKLNREDYSFQLEDFYDIFKKYIEILG